MIAAEPMRGALLFIVFNRPEVTARTFATIRRARPPRLYVAADGPRAERPAEAGLCAATRAIATAVDWPCAVQTRFLPTNAGCKRAVESAVSWFFAHERQGIVLEDDMLADASFFPFVETLLDRYADDARIGVISGLNLLPSGPAPAESYAFSSYFHMWGWGTWRRVWEEHDPAMSAWPVARDQGLLGHALDGRRWGVRHWTRTFEKTWRGEIEAWDNALAFSLWRQGRANVIPSTNMVTNIGFGANATYSHGPMPGFMRRAVPRAMPLPLRHPEVRVDPAFDARIEREALRIGAWSEAKMVVRHALGPLVPVLDRLRGR